jgi:hypothetical protein
MSKWALICICILTSCFVEKVWIFVLRAMTFVVLLCWVAGVLSWCASARLVYGPDRGQDILLLLVTNCGYRGNHELWLLWCASCCVVSTLWRSKHYTCPLNKFIWAFKVVKLFLKDAVHQKRELWINILLVDTNDHNFSLWEVTGCEGISPLRECVLFWMPSSEPTGKYVRKWSTRRASGNERDKLQTKKKTEERK